MNKSAHITCSKFYGRVKSALLFVMMFISLPLLQSQQSQLPEYKLKAVFLLNFTRFVEWPNSAFKTENDPFIIGILGKDPFGNYIDEAVAGEKEGTHPLRVVRYNNINEVINCQVLFIGDGSLPLILSPLSDKSVLTVSDMPGFTRSGGMIGFITVTNTIKLQVNPGAAKAAGLSISSKLLSLAEISK